MRKLLLIAAFGVQLFSAKALVTAYFNFGLFNIPSNSPFLETYLTVVGSSVKHKAVSGGFQGSVNVKINILRAGGTLYKSESYNLLGPLETDTLHNTSFIDNQRYALPNGLYVLEISLTDNNDPSKKPFVYRENLVVDFNEKQIQSSSIQPLESYTRSQKQSAISKSGFDLIPYNVNYYPENQNKLMFYFEAYNTDTVLGHNKAFIYTYFVQRKEDLHKMEDLAGFKRQTTASVNPLLAQLNISRLETGNYYLVVEIRDQNNVLQMEKKWFFQRKNVIEKPAVAAKQSGPVKRTAYEFFGDFNNADSLKMFVECLWPISNSTQREWEINQSIRKDPTMMKNFIVDFWQKRSGDSLDPLKMWLDYYALVKEVNANYKCGKQKGYFTDRGRVTLQYGKPNQRAVRPSEPNAYPYEIWQYYRIQDHSTGQFYTNRKFVFVNKMIVDGCYTVVQSDMKGELANDHWQYEVSKRDPEYNPNGANAPDPTYGSQLDDLYNNPR